MKKLMMGMVLGLLATVAAFGQQDTTVKKWMKPGKFRHDGAAAYKQLNLTPEQKEQMKTARTDFQSKLKEIESDENQTVKEQRDKRAALMQSQKGKMQSILTPEQQSQLTAMKGKATGKLKEHAGKNLDKMKGELNLTDAQMVTLKSNQAESISKLKVIKDNGQLDAAAKREQLKAMRDEMKKNFENVLTSEQQQKFQNMKLHRKGKLSEAKEVK